VERTPIKLGSPSFPVYGYDLNCCASRCRRPAGRESRGRHRTPLPQAACAPSGEMTSVRRDYSAPFATSRCTDFDWASATRTAITHPRRTDDVINVADIAWARAKSKKRSAMHPNIANAPWWRGRFAEGADAARFRGGEGRHGLGDGGGTDPFRDRKSGTVDSSSAPSRAKSVHFVSLLPRRARARRCGARSSPRGGRDRETSHHRGPAALDRSRRIETSTEPRK